MFDTIQDMMSKLQWELDNNSILGLQRGLPDCGWVIQYCLAYVLQDGSLVI